MSRDENSSESYNMEKLHNLLESLRRERSSVQHDIQVTARARADMERRVQETGQRLEQVRELWRQQQLGLMTARGRVEERRAKSVQQGSEERESPE